MRLSFVVSALLISSGAMAAESKMKQLFVPEASASSYLKSNWNKYDENYHPNYAFDSDPKTAWVEGKDGLGEGEKLFWSTSKLETATKVKLRIRNGYQKSKALFEANATPKSVQVAVLNKAGSPEAPKTFELKNAMGWQEIEIPLNEKDGLSGFELSVLSAYPGKKYKDTCISDIEVWVESKVPYDKQAEEKKRAQLKGWIKDRVKNAKFFANLPEEYPFAASRFESSGEPTIGNCSLELQENGKVDPKCGKGGASRWIHNPNSPDFVISKEIAKDLAPLEKEAVEVSKLKGWWTLTSTPVAISRAVPDLVGEHLMQLEPGWVRYASTGDFSVFEATQKIASSQVSEDNTSIRTNAKVSFQEDHNKKRIPKTVVYWTVKGYQERGFVAFASVNVLNYDSKGHLLSFTQWSPKQKIPQESEQLKQFTPNESAEVGENLEQVRLRYGSKGKVNEFTHVKMYFLSDYDGQSFNGQADYKAAIESVTKN